MRTRFSPSASGELHAGHIRTALYAWAWARHTGGRFVLRIEDADRARASEKSVASILDDLRWLGLDWDEGPQVGGDCGPYLQSERSAIYQEWVQRFLAAGHAYHCYCTHEELEAEREAQRSKGLPEGYSGRCRNLDSRDVARFRAEGREPVVRFRMPPGSTTVRDTVRGDVVFDHATIPDFVVMRANGSPLYNLTTAIDDALMQVTHVIRGEDLLAATPRQLAIRRAMGVPADDVPIFTHCPHILDADGEPISGRFGTTTVTWFRENGFLPEAVLNYLALLGWSPGDNREALDIEEFVALFDLRRVGATPGRFDLKKLEAINGEKIRSLQPADVADRILPHLVAAGLVADPPTPDEARLVTAVAPLIRERVRRLTDAVDLVSFLFVGDDAFAVDPEAAARILTEDSRQVLQAAVDALEALQTWDHGSIEHTLREVLVTKLGQKPKHAFGPVRVAATGRRVSPPLFESLELLGKERTLARIRRALAMDVG
ncbi:MAG TPA: glutamate--tRNA ligase [Actinopolymorphaceae bacterium]